MTKRLVLVAGNIGTGKTSITERIGARLGWQTSYESVSDNPYLPDFYGNMAQWSFHLQVFFLGRFGRFGMCAFSGIFVFFLHFQVVICSNPWKGII